MKAYLCWEEKGDYTLVRERNFDPAEWPYYEEVVRGDFLDLDVLIEALMNDAENGNYHLICAAYPKLVELLEKYMRESQLKTFLFELWLADGIEGLGW